MDPFSIMSLVSSGLQGLGSILPLFSKNGWKAATGSGLTDAQKEQNSFNAQEAQAQRDWQADQNDKTMQFNSQEAQAQRDWEERMSNTQYQRAAADMQAAGINPAMMYGGMDPASGATGSTASASSGGGASASGSGPGMPGIDMSGLSMLSDFALKQAQIRDLNASATDKEAGAKQKDSQTRLIDKTVEYYDNLTAAQVELITAQAEEAYAKIHLTNVNVRKGEKEVSVLDKQEENISADTALKRAQEFSQLIENAYKERGKQLEQYLQYQDLVGKQLSNKWADALYAADLALKEAQTDSAKASAAQGYAEAYMKEYTLWYLKAYGYLPGSSIITTGISGALHAIGASSAGGSVLLEQTNQIVDAAKNGVLKAHAAIKRNFNSLSPVEKRVVGGAKPMARDLYLLQRGRDTISRGQ